MELSNVLVGAIGGGLITYLAQNYARMLAEDVALLNDHISDISTMEEAAVAYWLSDDKHGSPAALRLRARVHGALSVVDCFSNHEERLLGHKREAYRELDIEFFELVTGGAFETATKEMDPDRASQIMGTAHRIRAVLRAARRSRYWAH